MILKCTGIAFIVANLTCTDVTPQASTVCPPVRTWSRDFQKQVATEMRAAPNSALARVAVQSIGDRDIARACARGKPK